MSWESTETHPPLPGLQGRDLAKVTKPSAGELAANQELPQAFLIPQGPAAAPLRLWL